MNTRTTALGVATAALALTLSACGLGTAGGFVPAATLAGPLEDAPSLDGAEIAIGSKNFSENILLGKIALIVLQAAGADVQDLTNIPGSSAARQAHTSGDIDAMWEYTGTGWLVYLANPAPVKGEEEQYVAVRDADREENGLTWLPPAPMNNTYAFAITAESAEKYGITKLSEMSQVPVEERTFCVESEFANRADGLEGMLTAYDIPLGGADGVPPENLQTYQTGAIYDATAKGECTFGEVFTTDGRIVALDLQVLEDDRAYFPSYNVSLVVREEVAQRYPEIEQVLAPVTEKMTDDALKALNAEIDVDGEEPEDVALRWLRSEGFVS